MGSLFSCKENHFELLVRLGSNLHFHQQEIMERPGYYSHIAKKARDLLYEDHNDNSFEFSPYVSGCAFASAFEDGKFMSTFSRQAKHGVNFKVKLSEDPREDPQFSTTFVVDQSYFLPGLKAIFSVDILEPRMVGLR